MVTIKESHIQNASTYLPLAVKEAMTRLMAQLCVEKLEAASPDGLMPLPPIFRENRMKRQQFLMGVLAGCYLKQGYALETMKVMGKDGSATEEKINYMMAVGDCDEWGESHIINQLERLKKSKTKGIADGVFDILQDYRMFENMLLGAIRDELERRNDITGRLTRMIQMQSSPELLAALQGELESVKAEMKGMGKDE